MKRKMNNVRKLDRNKMVGPMTEFVPVQNPPGAEDVGILATFENNKYGAINTKTVAI